MNEHVTRTRNTKGEPIDIVNKIVAGRYELFDTIAVGDRVQTWDGIWGTVAAFVPTVRVCADGEVKIFGADMLIYVDHLPYGYRFETGRNMVRHVEKYSSELYQCYTVRPVTSLDALHAEALAELLNLRENTTDMDLMNWATKVLLAAGMHAEMMAL